MGTSPLTHRACLCSADPAGARTWPAWRKTSPGIRPSYHPSHHVGRAVTRRMERSSEGPRSTPIGSRAQAVPEVAGKVVVRRLGARFTRSQTDSVKIASCRGGDMLPGCRPFRGGESIVLPACEVETDAGRAECHLGLLEGAIDGVEFNATMSQISAPGGRRSLAHARMPGRGRQPAPRSASAP